VLRINIHTAWICTIGCAATILVACTHDREAPNRIASLPENLSGAESMPRQSVDKSTATPHPQLDRPVGAEGGNEATEIAKRQQQPIGKIVTYIPSSDEFLNPERGLSGDVNLMSDRDFRYARNKGYTLARAYIHLPQYRNRPLSAEFLSQLDRQFQLVRSSGIKILPRFSYNQPTPADKGDKELDANLDIVLLHIRQLTPILRKNSDTIGIFQAGFIGAWGEWHSSSNKLDLPEPKAKVLAALLAATPANRMVQIRYAEDLRAHAPQALTRATAFRGNRQSRVGFHNDCFLSNPSDSGTYETDIPGLKNYISKIAPFIAIGGETCALTPEQHRTDCPTAQAELAKFHWSYLNAEYYKPDLDRWQQEGCYADISRKLGYRFELVRSDFPAQLNRDRQLNGNVVIKNVGYASPFNPRGLELILRHQPTGKVYRLPLLKPLSNTQDPRFWFPQVGEVAVDVRGKIPAAAPLGTYDLLLNLPDPMPKLANRPEYSIRLANDRTWEAKTGFNSLGRTIKFN
jgi:hypothetical protein